MKAHGIGPAVWRNIFGDTSCPPFPPFPRKDLQTWMNVSKRYYRAIDAITRGDRWTCGCRGESCSVEIYMRVRPFP